MARRNRKMNLAKRVARLEIANKPEKKRYYNDWQDQAIQDDSAGGFTINLDNIAQGVGENGRIGNDIKCSGIFAKFFVRGNNTNPTNLRLILLNPRDPNNTSYTALAVNGHLDDDQFVTYKDKFVALNPNGGNNCRVVTIRKKFKYPMNIKYSTSGGNSVNKGAIKIHCVSDQPIVGDAPQITGYAYMYYTDN